LNRFQKGELIRDPLEHCPGTHVTSTRELQGSTVSRCTDLGELVGDPYFVCSTSDRESVSIPQTRTAAARLLNINPAGLRRWLNNGHFMLDYPALPGDVEARLLIQEEIQRLNAVMDLVNVF